MVSRPVTSLTLFLTVCSGQLAIVFRYNRNLLLKLMNLYFFNCQCLAVPTNQKIYSVQTPESLPVSRITRVLMNIRLLHKPHNGFGLLPDQY